MNYDSFTFYIDQANVHWRSKNTATDEATSVVAVQEFIKLHPYVDYIVLIQCTSPFLKVQYLEKAIFLLKTGFECVFSVTRYVRFSKKINLLYFLF